MVVDRYGVERAEVPGASRHYLAMRRLIESCSLDSLAIRCWPELPGPAGLSQWVSSEHRAVAQHWTWYLLCRPTSPWPAWPAKVSRWPAREMWTGR